MGRGRGGIDIVRLWNRARSGDLRGAMQAARDALSGGAAFPARMRVELRLVAAACALRQGRNADALRDLDAAERAATEAARDAKGLALRVEAWRAEAAYLQGRYSSAEEIVARITGPLERCGDDAYLAFALRIRIAVLLARADYEAIAAIADRALAAAEASGDDYVLVQVLNVLGAVQFDRATSKLAEPHARSHLSSLEPTDAVPMQSDAREALRLFERAREAAERGGYEFAGWYVAGNIERLEILLGHADRAVRAIRKRLAILQSRGATYDEIVTRSNLGWALRTLGRHREALHEMDVALQLACATGTFNVLQEYLHYDRSVVLDALGDTAGARASYRRYVRLVAGRNRKVLESSVGAPSGVAARPLEPSFLKRADRFIAKHIGGDLGIGDIARHCGVSHRTLQKAFSDFRGLTPVAHIRNTRLDEAHRLLGAQQASVGEVAAQVGFGSPTTFALEYRKRFGTTPSRTRRNRP